MAIDFFDSLSVSDGDPTFSDLFNKISFNCDSALRRGEFRGFLFSQSEPFDLTETGQFLDTGIGTVDSTNNALRFDTVEMDTGDFYTPRKIVGRTFAPNIVQLENRFEFNYLEFSIYASFAAPASSRSYFELQPLFFPQTPDNSGQPISLRRNLGGGFGHSWGRLFGPPFPLLDPTDGPGQGEITTSGFIVDRLSDGSVSTQLKACSGYIGMRLIFGGNTTLPIRVNKLEFGGRIYG